MPAPETLCAGGSDMDKLPGDAFAGASGVAARVRGSGVPGTGDDELAVVLDRPSDCSGTPAVSQGIVRAHSVSDGFEAKELTVGRAPAGCS